MIKDCRKEGRLTIASNFTDLAVIYPCELWSASGGIWPRDRIGGEPKSTEIKHDFHAAAPPPPAKGNWRKGSNFPRKTRVLRSCRCHLAEGGYRPFFIFRFRLGTPLAIVCPAKVWARPRLPHRNRERSWTIKNSPQTAVLSRCKAPIGSIRTWSRRTCCPCGSCFSRTALL